MNEINRDKKGVAIWPNNPFSGAMTNWPDYSMMSKSEYAKYIDFEIKRYRSLDDKVYQELKGENGGLVMITMTKGKSETIRKIIAHYEDTLPKIKNP